MIFGKESINKLPQILTNDFNSNKVVITTYDQDASFVKQACDMLRQNKIEVHILENITEEPELELIDKHVKFARGVKCDAMVGIGGGSVLDIAKAVAMILSNGGSAKDYQNGKPITKKPIPFIAVPTTSGTGSEATRVCVATNKEAHVKKSFYSDMMSAQVVILDPTATQFLPKSITSATAMDALSHAVESYVSLNAHPVSEMFSLKAAELINECLISAYNDGNDLEARLNMALASYFAGVALTVGVGIAHIIAQPIGALYKIPHGNACSILLPESMKINLPKAYCKYSKLALSLGVYSERLNEMENANRAIEKVEQIRNDINASKRLSEFVDASDINIDAILENIALSTGHIMTNPVTVTNELLSKLITKCI